MVSFTTYTAEAKAEPLMSIIALKIDLVEVIFSIQGKEIITMITIGTGGTEVEVLGIIGGEEAEALVEEEIEVLLGKEVQKEGLK